MDRIALNAFRVLLGRVKEHPLARVGPGLITGVADDDPSGIATYSQAGAQFGLNMLWTMPLAFPLMAAIQSMCARHRPGHRKGARRQHQGRVPAGRASGRRVAAAGRQYAQYCRRRRRHGGSRGTGHRVRSPSHDGCSSCSGHCCCRSSSPITAMSFT